MVLQRDRPVNVRGDAASGETVTVSFDSATIGVTTDSTDFRPFEIKTMRCKPNTK